MPEIDNIALKELGQISQATTISETGKLGVDTSGGAFTITLASQLEDTDTILFLYDSTGNFSTNNATLQSGTGKNVNGGSSVALSTNWKVYTVTYTGSAFVVG